MFVCVCVCVELCCVYVCVVCCTHTVVLLHPGGGLILCACSSMCMPCPEDVAKLEKLKSASERIDRQALAMQLAVEDGTSSAAAMSDVEDESYRTRKSNADAAYVKKKFEAKKLSKPSWCLRKFKRGPGVNSEGKHVGNFGIIVWELCLEIMLLDISHNAAAVVYRNILSAMPGADTALDEWDYPEPAFFTEKLKQGQIICLLMNGFDLGTLTKGRGIGGDGTSGIDKRRGLQDYFSFVIKILDIDGEQKTVAINGLIKSFGSTAQDGCNTCSRYYY